MKLIQLLIVFVLSCAVFHCSNRAQDMDVLFLEVHLGEAAPVTAMGSLSDTLRKKLMDKALGELTYADRDDTNSFEGSFLFHTPDSPKLHEEIKHIFERVPFMRGARVDVMFGLPTSHSKREIYYVGARKYGVFRSPS